MIDVVWSHPTLLLFVIQQTEKLKSCENKGIGIHDDG